MTSLVQRIGRNVVIPVLGISLGVGIPLLYNEVKQRIESSFQNNVHEAITPVLCPSKNLPVRATDDYVTILEDNDSDGITDSMYFEPQYVPNARKRFTRNSTREDGITSFKIVLTHPTDSIYFGVAPHPCSY